MTPTKRCAKCGHRKPVTEFYRRPGSDPRPTRDGLQGWCKQCMKDRLKRWRLQNPAQATRLARRVHLRSYGLMSGDYDRMMDQQGRCCGICGRDDVPLVIDHDHDTGRVRGLLCTPCNTGMGLLGEDPERLRLAATWLETDKDERSVRRLPL